MTPRSQKILGAATIGAALLGGGALALRTPDRPVAELRAKYLGPTSRFLKLPSGAEVHYRDEGLPGGRPVLLVHGSNASLHTWEPWVALLRDRYRLVSVDLPGHGLTGPVPSEDYSREGMARFVGELLDALGLPKVTYVGNSMGGRVGITFALAHPERVDRLVLLDPGGAGDLLPEAERPPAALGFRLAKIPVLSRLSEWGVPRSIVEKTLRASFADQSKVGEDMVERYVALLHHPGSRRATRLRFAEPDPNGHLRRLGEVRVPTLVLAGTEDRLVPIAGLRLLAAAIPGAELVEYPGVGHIPMEEIPERSAADLVRFAPPLPP
ncbi:MAG: alpha/beta hydrolase [Deltaproteobacteria bacterium]|nr:alpha/beta hydrolase [Deltaproteobacteria bacterium]